MDLDSLQLPRACLCSGLCAEGAPFEGEHFYGMGLDSLALPHERLAVPSACVWKVRRLMANTSKGWTSTACSFHSNDCAPTCVLKVR